MRKRVFTPLLRFDGYADWDYEGCRWLCTEDTLVWAGYSEFIEPPKYCCAEIVENPAGVFEVRGWELVYYIDLMNERIQELYDSLSRFIMQHFGAGSTIDIYFHFGSTKSQFSHLSLPKP